jgi:hypothetical protein
MKNNIKIFSSNWPIPLGFRLIKKARQNKNTNAVIKKGVLAQKKKKNQKQKNILEAKVKRGVSK